MTRRALSVLLLCMAMIGLAPGWACASTSQIEDCCPPGKSSPCAPDSSTQRASVACCAAQAPQSPLVAVATTYDAHLEGVTFDSPAGGIAPTIPSVRSLACETPADSSKPPERQDQSLLYLRTGRLRL